MEFLIILLLLVLNGILPCMKLRWYHPAKHVLKHLSQKVTNQPVEFKTIGRTGKVLIYHSDRYYADRYRIRCVWWCGYCRRPRSFLFPHSGAEAYARNLAMITTVAIITYLSLIIGG